MSNESRDLSSISSHALDRKLHALRGEERNIQVDFLLHLLEFDTRRGWALLGHDSLWQYCRRGLGLLECAIWRRTRSMAILRRSPFVADYLRDGRITMTTLVLLEKVLTSANTRELFDRISHRNVREVEEIVAELRPRSDVPTSIRKLPQPARENREEIVVSSVRDFSAISENGAPGGEGARGGQAGVDETSIRTGAAKTEVPGTETRPAPQATDTPAAKPRVEIEPLARERYLLKMTVDREFVEALDKARSILSHVVRDGDRVAVLRRALDEIITRDAQRHAMKVERCEKKARESQRRRESSTRGRPPMGGVKALDAETRSATATATRTATETATATATETPTATATAQAMATAVPVRTVRSVDRVEVNLARLSNAAKRTAIPRRIAAVVRARDGHCCSWKMPGGGVCGSTWRLQIDHIHPFALGGLATVENLRLLCAAHNLQHARDVFGDRIVDRRRRDVRAARTSQEVRLASETGAGDAIDLGADSSRTS